MASCFSPLYRIYYVYCAYNFLDCILLNNNNNKKKKVFYNETKNKIGL